MLVLTRKVGEGIQIGDNIRVVVVSIKSSGAVQIGIDAPISVRVWRDELVDQMEDNHGIDD